MKTLAEELGIPWQRLDKVLRHGCPPAAETRAIESRPPEPETAVLAVPASIAPGLLSDKYRPVRLANLFGQPHVVRHLQGFAANPFPAAFLFSGETGIGKTSAALALATGLGCDLDQREFGGVHVIASWEQSAEAVRECFQRMWLQAPCGSGWNVFILNEAERMHVQAETIWLDRLETIPPKTVIVFTTNHPGKIRQRFRDRCVSLHFDSDAGLLRESASLLLTRIWRVETGRLPDRAIIDQVLTAATVANQLSFRRVVQFLQPNLTGKEGPHGNVRSDRARGRAKRRVLGLRTL